jgi:hypothetical protein
MAPRYESAETQRRFPTMSARTDGRWKGPSVKRRNRRERKLRTNEEPIAQTSPTAGSTLEKTLSFRISTFIKNLICLLIWTWLVCRIFGVSEIFNPLFTNVGLFWQYHHTLLIGTEIAGAAIILFIIFYKKKPPVNFFSFSFSGSSSFLLSLLSG